MKYLKIASLAATLFLSAGCGSLYYSDSGYFVHHYPVNSISIGQHYAPINSTYYRLGVDGPRPIFGGFRGGFHSHRGRR